MRLAELRRRTRDPWGMMEGFRCRERHRGAYRELGWAFAGLKDLVDAGRLRCQAAVGV